MVAYGQAPARFPAQAAAYPVVADPMTDCRESTPTVGPGGRTRPAALIPVHQPLALAASIAAQASIVRQTRIRRHAWSQLLVPIALPASIAGRGPVASQAWTAAPPLSEDRASNGDRKSTARWSGRQSDRS